MEKHLTQKQAIQAIHKYLNTYAHSKSATDCVKRAYETKWYSANAENNMTIYALAAILIKKEEKLKASAEPKKEKIIKSIETYLDFVNEFGKVSDHIHYKFIDFPSADKSEKNYDPDYAKARAIMLKSFKKECSKELSEVKRENGDRFVDNVKEVFSGIGEEIADIFHSPTHPETTEEKQEREEKNDYLNRIL